MGFGLSLREAAGPRACATSITEYPVVMVSSYTDKPMHGLSILKRTYLTVSNDCITYQIVYRLRMVP